MNTPTFIEHVFRHRYGELVASLVKRVGPQHFDVIEDAVQFAMLQALDFWSRQGQPDNPSAWLYQVAYRKIITEFRMHHRRQDLLVEYNYQQEDFVTPEGNVPLKGEMQDAMLKMLFVACHKEIPTESQLVFTLKSLLGFSTKEIALRLFHSEANVHKRFSRARHHLKKQGSCLEELSSADIKERLPTVLQVLYLVFTEGYLSSHQDFAIRQDLCTEAIRLAEQLAQSAFGKVTSVLALLALMYFHFARINSRKNELGALILFEQQDRRLWDQNIIRQGLDYLHQSAQGDAISRYHVEAGILAEHCLAPSFAETRWDRIVSSYELLHRLTDSPFVLINKAIALAEWQGPEAGFAILQEVSIPAWLERSYHWYAVRADLCNRMGQPSRTDTEKALELAPTEDIKNLLKKRLL